MSKKQQLAWWPMALMALLYPALYNGFPIVFFDTGAYILRAFEFGDIEPGRGVVYGLFIHLLEFGRHPAVGLWPVIVAQALLVIWMVALTARSHDLLHSPVAVAATIGGLVTTTGIAWYAAQLMPDIFTGIVVLGIYLLAFRSRRLGRVEQGVLMAVVIAGIAMHMAHVALSAGLALVLIAAFFVRNLRENVEFRLWAPLAAIALGILAIPTANYTLIGKFEFTPGGQNFIFGRLVQDGIVDRFLADHCPSPAYRLCDYRETMPKSADEWTWGKDSPLPKLGGWDGLADEMRRITVESLIAYPGLHAATALRSFVEQLVRVETGEELNDWYWHTRWQIERQLPALQPVFEAARQQQPGGIPFAGVNQVHVPVALGAMVAALLLMGWCAGSDRIDLAVLLGFVLVALLGNAFIAGVFSNPHDRYQSRVVWLVVLAVIVAGQGLARQPVASSKTTGEATG